MQIDPFEEMETDARNLRLTEQALFREVLNSKKVKFKKVILLTVMGFSFVIGVWVLFHCVLHVFKF